MESEEIERIRREAFEAGRTEGRVEGFASAKLDHLSSQIEGLSTSFTEFKGGIGRRIELIENDIKPIPGLIEFKNDISDVRKWVVRVVLGAIIISLLGLLGIQRVRGDTLPIQEEYDYFPDGVDSFHLPDKIKRTNLQDQINFRSDEKFGLNRREGDRLIVSTTATRTVELWRYFDSSNNEWTIRLDSAGTLSAGKNITSSSGAFTVVLSTIIDTSVTTDGVQALGEIWFINKINGLMSWDSVTFSSYPAAPKAGSIDEYKSRLVIGDIVNEQSSVRLSGALNGSDWTTDSSKSSSSVTLTIGGVNDGNKVYWVKTALDECLVGKANSTYAIYGNDQRDFGTRIVSPQIGSIFPRTVQQHGIRTIMLSNRGLDAYTPPFSFERISDPVQNLVDGLTSKGAISSFQLIDSQSQWELGYSSPTGNISTTEAPGVIQVVNNQQIDTSAADFTSGTFHQSGGSVSTSTINGDLVYTSSYVAYVAISTPTNGNFEIASTTSVSLPQGWDITPHLVGAVFSAGETDILNLSGGRTTQTSDANTPNPHLLTAYKGSYYHNCQCISNSGNSPLATLVYSTGSLRLLSSDGTTVLLSTPILTSVTTTYTDSLWNETVLNTQAYNGTTGRFSIISSMTYDNGGHCSFVFNSTETVPITASATVRSVFFNGINGSNAFSHQNFDLVEAGTTPYTVFSSSFVSRTFDTEVSSPNFDKFAGTFISSDPFVNFAFFVENSTQPDCCWTNLTKITTGSAITFSQKFRYAHYIASWTVVNSTIPRIASIQDVTLGSYSTGYFETGPINIGSNISSWGLFQANSTSNNGTISYKIQSSADGTFNEADWVSQSADSPIGVPINQYAGVRVYFNTQFSTNIPFTDSLTLNYNEGESPPDPTAVESEARYTLFYSTFTGPTAKNDQCLIYNRNDRFDRFSGIDVSAAINYSNKVLLGDPNPTGNIFTLDGSADGLDLTGPVSSYFKLPRYGSQNPDSYKIFEKLYVTVSRLDNTVSHRFRMDYSIDGSTTEYSSSEIEVSTGTNIDVLKFWFPEDQPVQGRYVDIKIVELIGRGVFFINRSRLYGTTLEAE